MIICEMCTNFRDLTEAKEMIRVAHEINPGGLVKFQLFDAEQDKGKPHYEWVKSHQLTFDQAKELFDFGASIGQEVFFSVFAPKFVDWCERIGVKRYKIAYSQRSNMPLIKAIRSTCKNIIVSLYMAEDEVECETLHCLWGKKAKRTKILFCIPQYPARVRVFKYYDDNWFAPFNGFSDHTIGLDAARIALARGASIIEKHFCLEHDTRFPDNAWSMTPNELYELVRWEKVCKEVL